MNKLNKHFSFKYLISLIIFILLNLNIVYKKNLFIFLCKHNYYRTKEIAPNEKLDGKIYFTCGICGKNKTEKIHKLNGQNYFIEILNASCEHGNGKRYRSKLDKNRIYEITYIAMVIQDYID